MVTRLSPPISNVKNPQNQSGYLPISIKEMAIGLSLFVDLHEVDRARLDQFMGNRVGPTVTLEGVPELEVTIPTVVDHISVSQELDRYGSIGSRYGTIDVSLEAQKYAPVLSNTMQEKLVAIAKEVASRIPENTPNRDYMVRLAYEAASQGALMATQHVKSMTDNDR